MTLALVAALVLPMAVFAVSRLHAARRTDRQVAAVLAALRADE